MMREWTVDLGSFMVEAETEEAALLQAVAELQNGDDIEIDSIIMGDVVDPQPECHIGAEGCFCRGE